MYVYIPPEEYIGYDSRGKNIIIICDIRKVLFREFILDLS
jgi:hypothetical protein